MNSMFSNCLSSLILLSINIIITIGLRCNEDIDGSIKVIENCRACVIFIAPTTLPSPTVTTTTTTTKTTSLSTNTFVSYDELPTEELFVFGESKQHRRRRRRHQPNVDTAIHQRCARESDGPLYGYDQTHCYCNSNQCNSHIQRCIYEVTSKRNFACYHGTNSSLRTLEIRPKCRSCRMSTEFNSIYHYECLTFGEREQKNRTHCTCQRPMCNQDVSTCQIFQTAVSRPRTHSILDILLNSTKSKSKTTTTTTTTTTATSTTTIVPSVTFTMETTIPIMTEVSATETPTIVTTTTTISMNTTIPTTTIAKAKKIATAAAAAAAAATTTTTTTVITMPILTTIPTTITMTTTVGASTTTTITETTTTIAPTTSTIITTITTITTSSRSTSYSTRSSTNKIITTISTSASTRSSPSISTTLTTTSESATSFVTTTPVTVKLSTISEFEVENSTENSTTTDLTTTDEITTSFNEVKHLKTDHIEVKNHATYLTSNFLLICTLFQSYFFLLFTRCDH